MGRWFEYGAMVFLSAINGYLFFTFFDVPLVVGTLTLAAVVGLGAIFILDRILPRTSGRRWRRGIRIMFAILTLSFLAHCVPMDTCLDHGGAWSEYQMRCDYGDETN